MKSSLIALTIVLFTNGCISTNKDYLINNVICNYNDPIFHVSKDELIIDIETGPGAILTGAIGGLIFGTAGYFGADWIADFIDEN